MLLRHTRTFFGLLLVRMMVSITISVQGNATQHAGITIEVCSEELTAHLSCSAGEVLMIDQAFKGRMKIGECIHQGVNIGCKADVQQFVERLCAGRQQCDITIGEIAKLPHGCPIRLDYYVEITYRCLSVFSVPNQRCDSSRSHIMLTGDSGYLASDVTSRGGQGSRDCPWLIKGPIGQAVNLTLLDFGSSPNGTFNEGLCSIYVELKSGKISAPWIPVCGRRLRQQHMYLESGTQDLSVWIRMHDLSTSVNPVYYLLHFQVHVPSTCSNFVPPSDAHVVKSVNNDTVIVRCSEDVGGRRAWNRTCRSGYWVVSGGTIIEDCSSVNFKAASTISNSENNNFEQSSNIPTGLIVLIAILFFLLVIAVIFMVCYMRRKPSAPTVDGQGELYTYSQYAGQNGSNMLHAQAMGVEPGFVGYQCRSQKDLLDCCNNTQMPTPQRQHRDYATTLEMRRIGNQLPQPMHMGPGQQGMWPHQQIIRTPDIWTTTTGCSDCPVHHQYGHYNPNTWTTGRRMPNHIYDLPMGVEYDEGDPCVGGGGMGGSRWPPDAMTVSRAAHNPRNVVAGGSSGVTIACSYEDAQPASPFYNELEPFGNLGSNTCILPAEDRRQPPSAAGENTEASWGTNRRQQNPPPIPLTKL